MVDYAALKKKVDELFAREWDVDGIKARINKMVAKGIPRDKRTPKEIVASRAEILDRVQRRAEEYNFIFKNCAQGTAMALMEEFGQGNMEIIKALTPFPGVGGTGDMCGGITGVLINFGLYFGSNDPLDLSVMEDPKRSPILISQRFMALFEGQIGHMYCADIIETVILGHRLNPGESDEAMALFSHEKGFEKCGLPPGTGCRLAAGIIIDRMK
ncbi:MAG TPA: C-GCAxxG-C-C family protein [Dehalococcoidales bacterium]|nr:C-GCAxxG-C-C family protein [Dehalococcoidales bacterium]